MLDDRQIMAVLHTIPDPEMPISIVDLGLVEAVACDAADPHSGKPGGNVNVRISLLPTFIGCPALDMIAGDVRAKVGKIPGVADVRVNWLFDPPWTVDRITAAGRASLKEHGVTVPDRGGKLHVAGHQSGGSPSLVQIRSTPVPCPFCGSRSTTMESSFGPTRCRMIYYCESCKNSFEHLKRIETAAG